MWPTSYITSSCRVYFALPWRAMQRLLHAALRGKKPIFSRTRREATFPTWRDAATGIHFDRVLDERLKYGSRIPVPRGTTE